MHQALSWKVIQIAPCFEHQPRRLPLEKECGGSHSLEVIQLTWSHLQDLGGLEVEPSDGMYFCLEHWVVGNCCVIPSLSDTTIWGFGGPILWAKLWKLISVVAKNGLQPGNIEGSQIESMIELLLQPCATMLPDTYLTVTPT